MFRKTWGVAFGAGVKGGLLAVSDDGRHVFAQDGRGVHVFDARTAEHKALLAGTGVPAGPAELWPVGPDKVLLAGPPHPFPSLWHVTGTRPGDILLTQLMPPATPDAPTRWAVSPDGRHLFVGSAAKKGQPGGTSLFKVFEVKSAQTVAQGWWQGGSARFTADGGRLLVAETSGRCRWLNVPGGAQAVGWAYPPAGVPTPLVSLSADGSLLLYAGTPAGLAAGRYLLDGRTGQVLRLVHPDPLGGPTTLTADGRRLVGVVAGELVVTDARTGTQLLRERFEGDAPTGTAIRADGRAVLTHDAARGELAHYEPRVPLPDFPAPGPPPAPLSPPPDPLPAVVIGPTPMGPPFFPQVGPPPTFNPPPPPPAPPVTVAPRPPAPPPLRPRWTAAADLANMTLRPEYAPAFTRDGEVVVQYGGSTGIIQAFDASDGTPLPGFSSHRGNPALGWLVVFGDRVASTGSDGKVAVWLARTGEKTTDLLFPEVPGLSSTFNSVRAVSPTGRYSALGRRPSTGKNAEPGAYKVLDTTTGKVLVEGPWHALSGSGQIAFTADELRVLVVNGGGTATWYKLPSGEKDAELPAGQGTTARTARVPSISADGTRAVFYGTLPGGSGLGTAVVNGRTGEVIRKLDNPPYQPAVASLSPDGKRLAVPVSDARDGILWHVDVLDVATGQKLGRITPPRESGAEVPRPRFSPDGRSVAVTFVAAKQVALYPADPSDGTR